MVDYPVVLISVARKTNQIQFSIPLSVIANALVLQGIDPHVIDLVPLPIETRDEELLRNLPDGPIIVGFSIMAGNGHLDETERVVKLVKKVRPSSLIVYGGPLPSSIPEMMLRRCLCDYVIHGEGEYSFSQMVKAIRGGDKWPTDIQGLYFLHNDKIHGTTRAKIRSLDKLSDPSFDHFDLPFYVNYLHETKQSWLLLASRGCWADCSFCYKFIGNGITMRSVNLVLDEIQYIIARFNLRRFYFVDENFMQKKKYFMEFLKEKERRGLDFKFICQSRIDTLNEERLRIGGENGLECVSTGVESISEESLNHVNKSQTLEDIERGIANMRRFGIRPAPNFIIGFPNETEQDYHALIAFIKRNGLEGTFKLAYLTPMPATRLFRETVDRGLIVDEFDYIRNLGDLFFERQVNLTQLPDATLDHYFKMIRSLGRLNNLPAFPTSEKYRSRLHSEKSDA